MAENLGDVLTKIGEDYSENISKDSQHYLEVNIAHKAGELGLSELQSQYTDVYAIVPLKHPVSGMKVRVDGRTFVNYAQFEFGVVVPNYVAEQVDLPHSAYTANDSMICNFA